MELSVNLKVKLTPLAQKLTLTDNCAIKVSTSFGSQAPMILC